MKDSKAPLAIVALSLIATACGNVTKVSDTPDAAGPDVAEPEDGGDTVPPIVLAVSPEDGTAGVLADTEIVIAFSEPMDTAATQAAYVSTDLPASEVSFTWNDTGDELTITPNEALTYAQGSDESVVAQSYTFAVVTSATDAAGNELAQPLDVTFSTARRIVVELAHDDAMSGSRLEGGGTATGFLAGDMVIGSERWARVLVTFNISTLPDDVLGWNAVMFKTAQSNVNNSPYAKLGDLHIHDVAFSTPTAMQAASEAPGDDLGVLSTNGQLAVKSADVQAALLDDLPGPRTQFLLKFATNHSGDTVFDNAAFGVAATRLEVDFLIE